MNTIEHVSVPSGIYIMYLSFDRLIPNCIFKAKSERRKLFIGDQLEECKDFSGLFYVMPFQKGFLVNWDVEKQIWDYMFGKEVMKVTCPRNSNERNLTTDMHVPSSG